MVWELFNLLKTAEEEISSVQNEKDLENWRIKYLGRKSPLSLFFKELKNFSPSEKKELGEKANEIRKKLVDLYEKKKNEFQTENNLNFSPVKQNKKTNFFDITQPGKKIPLSHLHPLTLVFNELTDLFGNLGFQIVEGPDIETEYYNFDALRIPEDHPAREMWDTFWLVPKDKKQKSKLLLRTHTSPMQIRFMEKHQPPFRIIVPGRCFRYEATDFSHEIQFHQIEGLVVDENVSLANFKSIVNNILMTFFRKNIEIRFRNSYFPFVSPGIEVDIKFKKAKSSVYKNKWLEIMGAGMVHPELFQNVGYEKNQWQGFAFGLGVERLTMLKYNIPDIRLFFSSDIRFLKQF
ncbi:MAG TPA: phenylalanine--tRNA ligase subunit alpha [Candidatus Paceibacterota bacterium]|jgi:phenylalanyl-tRNA synthetase alpha chain|nr:phenylalanine--tRNA ligase subunit alpha [Candidatus Paceibacterota bacterium]